MSAQVVELVVVEVVVVVVVVVVVGTALPRHGPLSQFGQCLAPERRHSGMDQQILD